MWHAINKGDQNSRDRISDVDMVLFIMNGGNNGWTAQADSNTLVSVFKDGRFIRQYEKR